MQNNYFLTTTAAATAAAAAMTDGTDTEWQCLLAVLRSSAKISNAATIDT